MELTSSVKEIYAQSEENIILTDAELNVIWKNHGDLPDVIDISALCDTPENAFILPVEKTATFEYKGRFADSAAMRFEPLRDNGIITNYLIHYYSCMDIERLSDKSGYLRFKSNFLGNIRMELSKMLAMLDSQKESFSSKAGTEYEHFDHEARLRILKTFSATVNMTELAKYFSGNFTTEYQSLSDICGEVCDEEGNLLEEDGCIFRYSIDPCIYFETNKSLIKNVLVNLLVNAYMYNDKEQRQVELILKTEDDRIILSVSDNGNGMTDDVWQAAITPFGTLQKYSSSEALGLALAKCFCDHFDGELSYRSEIGKGTCVTMSFPCDSRGLPKEFHVSRMPPIPNPYGSTYCIMAKGLDPLK